MFVRNKFQAGDCDNGQALCRPNLVEVAVNFGSFNAFLDTFMYVVLKTGCFYFFVKMEMAAILFFQNGCQV